MKRTDSNFNVVTLVVAVLALLAGFGRTAVADTYSLQSVFYTQSANFAGGDDFGNYTINISNQFRSGLDCGGVVSSVCYETHYINGAAPVYSTSAPALWSDVSPIAGSVDCTLYAGNRSVLCNNGHALYFGDLTRPNGSDIRGMFAGADPDPLVDYICSGSFDGGFMTANGNAYFIDGLHNTLDVALNLSATPVPEPQSLLLLGTGGVALIEMARRKLASTRRVG